MIQSRTHFSASVLNDEIFVFGGRNEKGILASSEKFSIIENKWSQIEKLRVPRCCHAQITIGDKIYISGGYIQGKFLKFGSGEKVNTPFYWSNKPTGCMK